MSPKMHVRVVATFDVEIGDDDRPLDTAGKVTWALKELAADGLLLLEMEAVKPSTPSMTELARSKSGTQTDA